MLTEAAIVKQIATFLDMEMEAGVLYWDRLNSGNVLAQYGKIVRNIKLCRKGTADIMVLKRERVPHTVTNMQMENAQFTVYYQICRLIFLEVKRPGRKPNDDQLKFKALVEAQGAEYHVVHTVLDVAKVLE